MKKRWLWGALLCLLLLPLCCACAEEARDITASCRFHLSINRHTLSSLFDGRYKTYWNGEKNGYVEIETPEDDPCAALYIHWSGDLMNWQVETQDENGQWTPFQACPAERYYHEYVPLKEPLTHFRISSLKNELPMCIGEISVLSKGDIPSFVQIWKPFEGKADLMVLVAHPDDELLFMGGVIPYYRGQEGKKVIVCYMARMPGMRKCELLDGLWHCGVREYPEMPSDLFPDASTTSAQDCLKIWKEQRFSSHVAMLIRKYQPDVIVTHAISGEYGHGAHRACAYTLRKCITQVSDPEYFPESAAQYGVWQPKKLYLHLYEGDLGQIDFDWRQPLTAFDGKTAFEVASEAFKMHVSQKNTGRYTVQDDGKYDNSLFGLFYSEVGADSGKNDLFENLFE